MRYMRHMLFAAGAMMGVLGGVSSASASGATFVTTFSALPYSFPGVSSCDDQSRRELEAQTACMGKARQSYGDKASIDFVESPDWSAPPCPWHDECQQYFLGVCVDYARECSCSFSKLNCTMEITFP